MANEKIFRMVEETKLAGGRDQYGLEDSFLLFHALYSVTSQQPQQPAGGVVKSMLSSCVKCR